MENASKALIIAGAILLSILIIGLGMFIYSQAEKVIGGINLDPEKVAAYNSPFEQYGETQSGSEVKALLDKIRTHNNAYIDDPTSQINVLEKDATSETSAPETAVAPKTVNDIKAKIGNGKTYNVTFGYDANSGLIIAVGIEQKKSN